MAISTNLSHRDDALDLEPEYFIVNFTLVRGIGYPAELSTLSHLVTIISGGVSGSLWVNFLWTLVPFSLEALGDETFPLGKKALIVLPQRISSFLFFFKIKV